MIGDNGVLTQAQQASIKTAKASFLEEANMAYADKYSEEMETGNFYYEVTLEDIKDKLGEEKIIAKSVSGTTYTITGYKVGTTDYVLEGEGEKFTTESPLRIPSTGSKTLEVKTSPSGGDSTRYFGLVQGGYYEMEIPEGNSKISFKNENPMTLAEVNALGESSPTLSVTLKSGSTGSVTVGDPSGKTVELNGTTTTGVGTLTVEYGNATPTEIPIKVTGTYTVNLYSSSTATNATELTVAEDDSAFNATGYSTGKSAADSAAPNGQSFDKWVLKTAVGSNTVGTDATDLMTTVTSNLDVYATFTEPPVKYAVQIYGINQDVGGANGSTTLGLTFGPAVGANYNNSYVTHAYEQITEGDNAGKYYVRIETYNVNSSGVAAIDSTKTEYLKDSNGENVLRTAEEYNNYKDIILHDMTWNDIKNVTDKTKFYDCMLCGDTKCVKLNLNSTIKSGTAQTAYGDGAGLLSTTINSNYRKWNSANVNDNADLGYASSRIRATLVGKDTSTKNNTSYAGEDVLTSENCLYSCIEQDLKNVITEKTVNHVTGSSSSPTSKTVKDKIWLFSFKELAYTFWNGEGIYNSTTATNVNAYQKFKYNVSDNSGLKGKSKYYIGSSDGSTTNRVAYNESGYAAYWWSRSPLLQNANDVYYVNSDGSGYGNVSANSTNYGLAFGFCIQ